MSTNGSGYSGFARQARLRPEFARLYPELRADEWHLAEVMVDIVVAAALHRGDARFLRRDRVLSPEHFEFQFGPPPDGGKEARRASDREG